MENAAFFREYQQAVCPAILTNCGGLGLFLLFSWYLPFKFSSKILTLR